MWARGGLRKLCNRAGDHAVLRELTAPERSGRWFLMPLQVHNDSQILRHSHYPGMEAAIDEVMASFAANAHGDDWLVLKHHPMDRAYRDYTRYICGQAQRLGIQDRVRYVHDLHMPTLLKHTRGMVTVNSTTGLQALHHRKPVITLGECVYAVEGLVHAGPLDLFWQNPGEVDIELFYRFKHHLIEQSQLNASFYAHVPAFVMAPARPAAEHAPAPTLVQAPAELAQFWL
jgi:capsule polysaccharide modification protein KpsS